MSDMKGLPQTATVRVGRRSTVVIPAALRKQVHIEEGDELQVTLCGDELVLRRIPSDPLERFRQAFRGVYRGVDADAYIRALRDEWDD
jgi:AbrB family looped-hinge helix DNA binding protein